MLASRHLFWGLILFAMKLFFWFMQLYDAKLIIKFSKGRIMLKSPSQVLWTLDSRRCDRFLQECTSSANTNEQMYIQMKLPLHPVSAGRRTIGVIGSLLEQCVHRSVDKIPQRNTFLFKYIFITSVSLFITIL